MRESRWVNLTNGLEWLRSPTYMNMSMFDGVVRIQSTACEQKRWGFILGDLDYGFLMALALGRSVSVWDAGANKTLSRALYQGVPWIEYAINRVWFGIERPVFVKKARVPGYFEGVFRNMDPDLKRAVRKLEYVQKFLRVPGPVDIQPVCRLTELDARQEELRRLL